VIPLSVRVGSAGVAVLALATVACGQDPKPPLRRADVAMHLFHVPAPARTGAPGEDAPIERLARVLRRLPATPGDAPLDVETNVAAERSVMMVRGGALQTNDARTAIEALAQPTAPALPLQCTAVSVPAAVARAHALPAAGSVASGDGGAALMRDAVKAGGTLRNLPEALVTPLAPFAVEAGAAARGDTAPQLRVRGVLAALAGREIAIALDVEQRALADAQAAVGGDGKWQPVHELPSLRLSPGRCAVAVVAGGDPALVLVVRLAEPRGEDRAATERAK
jgi:hypothetical protein